MKSLFILLLITFFTLSAFSQTGKLTAKITDTESNAIPFTSVLLTEINQSVVTDDNGNYTFQNIPYGTYTITFKMVGFTTKMNSIVINKPTTTLSIHLETENNTLYEVEVFGVRNKQPDKLQKF